MGVCAKMMMALMMMFTAFVRRDTMGSTQNNREATMTGWVK